MGMVLSQGIQVIAAPVLGRLYNPTSFGEWTLILSVAGMASSIGGLRYELAIVPAADDQEAVGVMMVQTLSNLGVSFLALALVVLFGHQIASMLGAPGLSSWLYFVPLIALLTGLGNIATYGLIRSKCFKELALYRSAQSLSGVGYQAAAGWISGGPGGLIVGGAFGQLALAGALWTLFRRRYGAFLRKAMTRDYIWECAHKHRNFPKFMVAYGLAGVFRDRGLLLVLGSFGTAREAGLYAFALRIIYAPMGLISNSFNSVIYQKAAEAAKPSDVGPLVYRVISRLVMLSLPIFIVVAWFATRIFGLVFGRQWEQAGLYAAIMIPPAFTHLLAGPFDRMFDIVGRQKIAMSIEVVYSVVGLASFSVCLVIWHNVALAVTVFSGITALYDIVWIVAVYYAYGFPYSDLARIGARIAALGSSVIAALWLLTSVIASLLHHT